jgi:Rod binding domain-containing protein
MRVEAPAPQAARAEDPRKVAEAAREFEALFLVELLKTTRQAGDALAEPSEMTGAENYREFAERFLADALAKSEALGLGKLLRQSLEPPPG